MSLKKRYVALLVAAGCAVGWLTLGGTAAVMHYTSSTEFCLSCHSMQLPYEEYQGSVHFSNSRGIRAECADCHIPSDPIDYLITKVRATKDIYHEFVTGKIDDEDKYEQHRLAMAETVWAQMRENDSATCRSCHSYEAMDTYAQNEESVKMHQYGIENNQTCIDCHKGMAHFAPEPEMDSEAFDNLMAQTAATDAAAKVIYPIQNIEMGDLGTINPTVALEVLSAEGTKRQVKLAGYQMKGAEQVMYMGEGQRAIIASLTDQGQAAVEHGEYQADEYGNEWRSASLVAEIDAPVLASQNPIWDYAEELDNVYCATCHAKIPANHFTVNAWGPVAKGMGDRTDISSSDLEILTKFFQNHAKDVAGH
ncbi:NapC/NirT family cytochrome c [Vibrio scophthalmi]|uniref:Cytochrome c-type protein n=1 Tax=Vibrio scophthalmi TaxID=45658 RepID=A0A1E3WN43_9VIBR|nr:MULTISPECIES: NapC/NirT family cytochrome c [Vibrio]EGU33788.1 cytochrome c-type protein YecK [Vibrio sp. N418]MCY9803797.1 NapC/NirT family cytochrome c [Vibrio scophthalmi]ODS11176.1 Cytochrome c-type protein TorY [Vibrio scophthalmi]